MKALQGEACAPPSRSPFRAATRRALGPWGRATPSVNRPNARGCPGRTRDGRASQALPVDLDRGNRVGRGCRNSIHRVSRAVSPTKPPPVLCHIQESHHARGSTSPARTPTPGPPLPTYRTEDGPGTPVPNALCPTWLRPRQWQTSSACRQCPRNYQLAALRPSQCNPEAPNDPRRRAHPAGLLAIVRRWCDGEDDREACNPQSSGTRRAGSAAESAGRVQALPTGD